MAGITTTNEVLDDSETGVDITPALTDATRPSLIMVNDEIMEVSAGTTTLTVTRGARRTSAVSHLTAQTIYKVESVSYRGDSILVYYYGDDGALAAKKIVVSGDLVVVEAGTVLTFDYTQPADLTDSTTGVAGAEIIALREDTVANLAADVRVGLASIAAQLATINAAVNASTVSAS